MFAAAAQGPATAHEFWIQPEAYQIQPGETARAAFHVGETFKGPTYIYVPSRSARFEHSLGGETAPVAAEVGDNPAYQLPDAPEGLVVVVHQTAPQALTYRSWSKFQKFIDHKDFAVTNKSHAARGLPEARFTERYTRFAKTLIGVGDSAGADRVFGLRTEIVALANPYTDDLSDGLTVRVLLDGAPRANAQVELFERAPEGGVTVTLHRTDAAGLARLPVRSGHMYLVDAVHLLEVDPAHASGAAYHSLWAALTFAVP